MNSTDYATIQNMRDTGGSFVKALAGAMGCADPENLQRIKSAFPEIMARYAPTPFPDDDRTKREYCTPMPCPGCKGFCDRHGECTNTGCAFGPDDETAPPFGPHIPHPVTDAEAGL